VKILVYDGTGLVLLWKRLEGAKLKRPAISDGVMRPSAAQLATWFEGLHWRRVYAQASGGRGWPAEGPTLPQSVAYVRLTHLEVEDRTAAAAWIMPAVRTPDTLPDDVTELRALVLRAWAERGAERAEMGGSPKSAITRRPERPIAPPASQLQRMQFGRRSEKLDPDQFNLALENLDRRSPNSRPNRRRPIRRGAKPARTSGAPDAARSRGPSICRGSRSTILCKGKAEIEPEAIVTWLNSIDVAMERVRLEACLVSPWLYGELYAAGLPAVCIGVDHTCSDGPARSRLYAAVAVETTR
jgi:hypothetical protein